MFVARRGNTLECHVVLSLFVLWSIACFQCIVELVIKFHENNEHDCLEK